MRLKITQLPKNRHKDFVSAVSWSQNNFLYSCSDDNTILKWNLDGECLDELTKLNNDVYITSMDWYPVRGHRRNQRDILFAFGCSDGSFSLFNAQSVKVEHHHVKAHRGAITCLRWNHEGSAFLTSGEDGQVLQWAESGCFRSPVTTAEREDQRIYSVSWSPTNKEVIYAINNILIIKPILPSAKKTKWRGSKDGLILSVDWNMNNNLIISGGEDKIYRVWDNMGQMIYQCQVPFHHPITAVKWCPSGDFFAVGSFNLLYLCDKTGWVYSRTHPNSGSIYNINWTSDGTTLAGAGGNGSVVFAQIVDRLIEYNNFEIVLNEFNQVIVRDVFQDDSVKPEELSFNERVIGMSMSFGYLLVYTVKKCFIYQAPSFSSPTSIELKGSLCFLMQCRVSFLCVDSISGINLYNYDGVHLFSLNLKGVLPEYLSESNCSLSEDIFSFIDPNDCRKIQFIDISSNTPKILSTFVEHESEIIEISLCQQHDNHNRIIGFIDSNKDLYLSYIQNPNNERISSMIDSLCWNDDIDILCALANKDKTLYVWFFPQVAFMDKSLLNLTSTQMDVTEYKDNAKLVNYIANRLTILQSNGAVQVAFINPYPAAIQRYCFVGHWARAVRLCRLVNDNLLWAVLATVAIHFFELVTAETALAAINEIDKLAYIQHIRSLPINVQRAELCLMTHRIEQAQNTLLQNGYIYRAIKLNIRLHRWVNALDIAIDKGTHVDTVLYYRKQYLENLHFVESEPKFIKALEQAKDTINWENISKKKKQAKEMEELDRQQIISNADLDKSFNKPKNNDKRKK